MTYIDSSGSVGFFFAGAPQLVASDARFRILTSVGGVSIVSSIRFVDVLEPGGPPFRRSRPGSLRGDVLGGAEWMASKKLVMSA